eukprot:CAMPEP_0180132284 /NCGR_PEP_ID=MMETSP0986-20121125/8897_1 /TAXON_ID=697907 /ORGANISM="non described non described, Strain CCMP2293" /LENGTH=411 /DNA_ID=CAMNT_0022072269 /DNA_START=15 /DNA_END=1250 /DNA_ORIENTATION=+
MTSFTHSVFLASLLGVAAAFSPSSLIPARAAALPRSACRAAAPRVASVAMKYNLEHPKIANDITEVIGRTPLLRLPKEIQGECKAEILLKMESMQPCNSVKDRIGLAMIESAEKRGEIKPGETTLVEPTSGNTGVALAMVAAARGYELVLCMPESMSLERRVLFLALGAKLVLTPAGMGMNGAIKKAENIVEKLGKKAKMLQQFNNPDNVAAHMATTGPEVWEQTDGKIDVFLGGVGTGGTLTGTSKFLKTKNAKLLAIAVEPEESAVLSGGKPGPHKIQGIGAGFIPGNCDMSIVDDVVKVTGPVAMEMARRLGAQGILCGISSGAAVTAALEVGNRPGMAGKRIVAVIPSFGERYLSTALFQPLLENAQNQKADEIQEDIRAIYIKQLKQTADENYAQVKAASKVDKKK